MCSAMESVRTGAVDEWYIDDGQGFVSVALAERWLKSIDQAIASFGGRRETGSECKSVARLICPAPRMSEFSGWESGYIEQTCEAQPSTAASKVLGSRLGSTEEVTAHFQQTSNEVIKAREAISVLESSQCELVLQRRCFDVSKVTYLVRCNGDRVQDSALHEFDAALRGGTEDALYGRMCDESWIQATLGADAGGLGMKEVSVIALPAFIASRVASRALVEEMCRHTEEEGIATVTQCMTAYDARSQAACARWSASLPEGMHDQARLLIEAAAAAAVRRWRSWCEGNE